MTLPIKNDDDESILLERPGDDIFPEIKHLVDAVDEEEKEVKPKLVDLILKDLVLDAATANACDDTGKILTYLSQKRGIEPAEFTGEIMMRNFSRITKLKLSLDFAKMVGLEGDVLDLMIRAEIERLWGDTNSALLKKLLVSKMQAPQPQPQQPQTGVNKK